MRQVALPMEYAVPREIGKAAATTASAYSAMFAIGIRKSEKNSAVFVFEFESKQKEASKMIGVCYFKKKKEEKLPASLDTATRACMQHHDYEDDGAHLPDYQDDLGPVFPSSSWLAPNSEDWVR